jgi:hypothetical protein
MTCPLLYSNRTPPEYESTGYRCVDLLGALISNILHVRIQNVFSPVHHELRRWADDIKMDLKEIRLDGVDWIDLAQDETSGRLSWTR